MSHEEVLGIQDPLLSRSSHILPTIRLYKKRFFILLIYSFECFLFFFLWYCFISISKNVELYYGVSVRDVNFLANIVPFFMVPVTFLTFYTNNISLKYGVCFGSVCLFLASWIRYLGCHSYTLLLLGQSIMAIGLPFIINISTELVENWFCNMGKGSALTFAIIFQYLGTISAFLLPPMFVLDESDGIPTLLLTQAILCTFCVIAMLIIFQPLPPTPSSFDHTRAWEKFSVNEALLMTVRNQPFMLLTAVVGIGYGVLSAFPVLLPQIMVPLGYSNEEIGMAASLILIVGILSCSICEVFWSYIRENILFLFKVLILFDLMAFAFIIVSFQPNHIFAVYVGLSCLGFFTLPLLPLALVFATEMTYPIAENISNGLMLSFGNSCGFVLTILFAELQDSKTKSMQSSLYCMFGLMAFALLLSSFINFRKPYTPTREEEAAATNRDYYYNSIQSI